MSSNYLEFVDRALPAARDGDVSAQFALYQALEYCEDGYRGYFDRPGKRRLEKASAAGFPAAQSRKALDELRAAYLQSMPWPDRTALTAKEFDEQRASAGALLLKAIATGDPSATWDAADTIYYLTGSGSTAGTEQSVWMMAACIQGYDCAPGAEWVAAFCHYQTVNPCQGGEAGTEIIRQAWVQASGQSDTSDFDERA